MALVAGTATVCGRFQQTATRHRGGAALTSPGGPSLSWEQYGAEVRHAAAALDGLGLRRGDVLGCWLANRPEFHVADAAAMHLGVTSFSVYDAAPVPEAEHVVADSGARVLVTEAAHMDAAIAIRAGGRTALEHIVLVDGDAPEALGWDELLEFARPGFDFDAAWHAVEPSDVAALVYTAGTTGPPKGVELTHANLTAQAEALFERLQLPDGARIVSAEPMAHVTARLAAHYLPIFGGWQVACCPDARLVVAAVADVRPDVLCAPPRVWAALRVTVLAGSEPEELLALETAMAAVRAGADAQDGDAQRAVRERIGLDAAVAALAVGAPCPQELLVFWRACGVALAEAYGCSETTGVATVDGVALGTCELRVDANGMLRVRGAAVAQGYRGRGTAVDADGWLATGDAAVIGPDGRVALRRTAAHIEAELQAGAQLFGHACVVGEGRPYHVVLLALAADAARAHARRCGIRADDLGWLAQSRRIVEAVAAEVAAANERLPASEQIRRFLLLGAEWSPAGDELTPAWTLRRGAVERKYARQIEALYTANGGVEP